MATTETKDAVTVFCEATRARDIDLLVRTLAPDAELFSPLFGRMVFRGRDDLRVLLGAVYGGLSNLVWREVTVRARRGWPSATPESRVSRSPTRWCSSSTTPG